MQLATPRNGNTPAPIPPPAASQPKAPTETALAVRPSAGVEPQTLTELRQLATDAAASGFYGAKSPAQALMVLMAGRDLGLSYPQALRAFHVIENRPALSAQGMVAVCLRRHDVCRYFRTIESTGTTCTVETQREGDPPRRATFSDADAKTAGLWGRNTWAKYPRQMLLSRAQSALAREVYPDILLGLYDPEELGGIVSEQAPAPPVVTVMTPDGELVEEAPAAPPSSPFAASLIGEFEELLDHLPPEAQIVGRKKLVAAGQDTVKLAALVDRAKEKRAALGQDRSPEPTPERGDAFEPS